MDVTFSVFADRCPNPERDIRLVLETPFLPGLREVPFQLSRLSRWTKDADGNRSLPTLNGMITFFDEAPGSGDAQYYLLYGNLSAQAPVYPSDLSGFGEFFGPPGPWYGKMIVRLHGKKDFLGGRIHEPRFRAFMHLL